MQGDRSSPLPEYEIEIGDSRIPFVCSCCGNEACIGNGFVYKNGDAHAAYCAMWSIYHPDGGVNIAIGIGEWGDERSPGDRTCFALIIQSTEDEYTFRVVEPDKSAWKDHRVLGDMLSRSKGINHPLLSEVFAIAERIIDEHPAIGEYLSTPS